MVRGGGMVQVAEISGEEKGKLRGKQCVGKGVTRKMFKYHQPAVLIVPEGRKGSDLNGLLPK